VRLLVALVQFWAKKAGLLVVSTERLILWWSEIFGGISNEISVLLDKSTNKCCFGSLRLLGVRNVEQKVFLFLPEQKSIFLK
jgi:hypothetical protein